LRTAKVGLQELSAKESIVKFRKLLNRITERTSEPFFHWKKGRQQVMLRDLEMASYFSKTFKMTAVSVFWQIFAARLIPNPSP
jgi:isocitrate lyase